MRDTELYGRILGIEPPWQVMAVELALEGGEVRVRVGWEPRKALCPECGAACPRHDTRVRRWRHLDTCQYRTLLIAAVPRVRCSEHGVLQVKVPWAEPGSRFTALYEALIIDWLQVAPIQAVARQLGLSWDEVDGVMQRAVRRGLERRSLGPPRSVGVDETSFQRRHEYVTVVSEGQHVLWVADGRGREALESFWEALPPGASEAIESVAMDMWGPYISATVAKLPDAGAKIAFDKFHVAWHLNRAVDEVRRQENKALTAAGDERLKGTKYLWLRNPEEMSIEQLECFEAIQHRTLKTARAWAIKEAAMELWWFPTRSQAEAAWEKWYAWAIRSRLAPIKRVARMIRRHLRGIINAILLDVTNARAEGFNSTIQWLKKSARGFRNRDRFRNAIYFRLGGLDLYPDCLHS
jgi:transposase